VTRTRLVLIGLWWALGLGAIVVTVRLTRYTPVPFAAQALVLDRWRHEFCTVSNPPRCFPVR
jgi:hypothetical protein